MLTLHPYLSFIVVALIVFLGMEAVAWATHKYVMHGPLWVLHASHHRIRHGALEANDWFGVFFSVVAVGLFAAGRLVHTLFFAAGAGMTAYGLAYLFLHDILNHKRFGISIRPRSRYLRAVLRSHRVHHARREKDGCVSFGFLVPARFPRRNGSVGPVSGVKG